ncbi:hypothetical protein A9Q99_07825 [Gammaproteobacteria bacterium 45_16_T64]|nr:hypothetical protein A9Q99_07825 [Gammaproteobacteria bacterium 45_16_T64]
MWTNPIVRLGPKLLTASCVGLLILVGVAGGLADYSLRNVLFAQIDSALRSNLFATQDAIDRENFHIQNAARVIASDPAIRKALDRSDSLGINSQLNRIAATYPDLNYLMLIDPDQRIFAINTINGERKKIHSESLLAESIKSHSLFSPLPLQSTFSGAPGEDGYLPALELDVTTSQWIVAPVIARGRAKGWVVLSYQWEAVVGRLLKQKTEQLLGQGFDIVGAGVISSQDFLMAGEYQRRDNVFEKKETILLGEHRFDLVMQYSKSQQEMVLQDLRFKLIVAIVPVLIVLLFIGGWLLRRSVLEPIATLEKGAKRLQGGDLYYRLPVVGKDEFSSLMCTFNSMGDEIAEANKTLEHNVDIRTIEITQINKQLTLALKSLKQQSFAFDQHAIVFTTDTQGSITMVNDRFCRLSGYSTVELLHENCNLFDSEYHSEYFWEDMYSQISNGNVWNAEIKNRRKDGGIFWVDTTIVPFVGDDGVPINYVAISSDITERKKAEFALIKAKEGAEAATLAKGEFLASMSHEIRTPMNGVLGMLGLLLNSALDKDQHHKATVAQTSARALLTVINDILDFSKVDAGKLELEELDFDLRTLLDEFAESMALRVEEKGVELILDVTNVELSKVRGDPGRIRQILVNLVGNSIKFTQSGEIMVRANVREVGGGELVFSCTVRDTGIGIPEHKRVHLFDAFTQVDASTTRKYGGTGLGLSIVKQLCELMGGCVSVASEIGEGSCFEFILLLKKSDQSKKILPIVDTKNLQLLIVDDNETNRVVMRGQLEHWGASVEDVSGGESALTLLRERARDLGSSGSAFDVAFLDMQMPNMNGAELGRAIKSDPSLKDLKLVMMTSMGHRGDAKYFSDLGFSGYFSKPVTTSDLFDTLVVVADGGAVLDHATPLVTHHYLQTLDQERKDISWPEGIRLLLVEDNPINQEVVLGMLEDVDLTADVANDGKEALGYLGEASEENPYDLVMMDCQMPEMDGYEATKLIRAGKAGYCNQNIIIIAMTGNAMVGDKQKCLDAGMNDYLSKPLEPNDLEAMLLKWVGEDAEQKIERVGVEDKIDVVATKDSSAAWNQDAALKRLGGRESMMDKLISLYVNDMPNQLAEINICYQRNDLEGVCMVAHTIKGVSANLSGVDVQQCAGEIESAAKFADSALIDALLPKLESAYDVLSELLVRYTERHGESVGDESGAEFSGGDLIAILNDLLVRIELGDFIDEESLVPLKQLSLRSTVEVAVAELLEQLDQFELDRAAQSVRDLVAIVEETSRLTQNEGRENVSNAG